MTDYSARDYTYRLFWSDDDEGFVATVAEFPSLSNIDASQEKALSGMVGLLQAVLEDMQADGDVPPVPISRRSYSGHISLRITPEQHRRIAIEAAEQGVSINRLIASRA